MHTVILVRHAHAVAAPVKTPHVINGPDYKRPLRPGGVTQSEQAGRFLGSHSLYPSLVLCSPSVRTMQTWHGISGAMLRPQVKTPIFVADPRIYMASADWRDLSNILAGVPDAVPSVMLIGHNPAIADLSGQLGTETDMPVATVCVFRTNSYGGLPVGSKPVMSWSPLNTSAE